MGNGDDAGLAALAKERDSPSIKIDLVCAQAHQFVETKTRVYSRPEWSQSAQLSLRFTTVINEH